VFAQLKMIALDAYDRIVGLLLDQIAVDGCITKAPGGGECAGPSPVDRRKQGMKRSMMVEGDGIPLGRVLAGANRHDSPLPAPTLDQLTGLGPLPADITVHLDSGYDSGKTREELAGRGLNGQIAHKGEKAPIQASGCWHVERTNSRHNAFNWLQRCYERRECVIEVVTVTLDDHTIHVRPGQHLLVTSHEPPPRTRSTNEPTTTTLARILPAGSEFPAHCDNRRATGHSGWTVPSGRPAHRLAATRHSVTCRSPPARECPHYTDRATLL
jgi:hypothetical protein